MMLQTSFDNLKCAVHVPDTGEFLRRMTLTERKTLQAQNKTDKKKIHFLISLLLFPLS